MQVLKEEIRNNIIKIAEMKFLENSFNNTSTRDIAKLVNISVSNLYKYFKNKEDIFETIVSDYYINYKIGLARFVNHSDNQETVLDAAAIISNSLYNSIVINKNCFILLMDKSQGTKYELFFYEVVEMLANHILQSVRVIHLDTSFVRLITENFFRGIVQLTIKSHNNQDLLSSIELLVDYHLTGISRFY